ncbi:MAG: hypothetical protein RRY34_09120, partial [Victivallaceae bacterium]
NFFMPHVGGKIFCEFFSAINLLPWLILFIVLLASGVRSGELASENSSDIFRFFLVLLFVLFLTLNHLLNSLRLYPTSRESDNNLNL